MEINNVHGDQTDVSAKKNHWSMMANVLGFCFARVCPFQAESYGVIASSPTYVKPVFLF